MGQRKGWMVIFGAGMLATAGFIGCSADGGGDDFGLALEPTEPGDTNTYLPPPSTTGEPTPVDAGAKESKDAGKKPRQDAGPPPPPAPNPGEACATPNEEFIRQCGACGTQSALCEADGKVSEYGPCEGEVGECTPGTVREEACGNCGKSTVTCDAFCTWPLAQCTGEPANACTPGGVDLTSASCGKDLFRSRTCSESCTYGNFSDTCSAPPTLVRVPPTPGMTNSTFTILKSTQVLPYITGTCATAAQSTYGTPVNSAPYAYLTVRNPGTKAARVTIAATQVQGGPSITTTMAVYPGIVAPTTLEARRTCTKGFTYSGSVPAVEIGAGQTVTVFVGARENYDPQNPTKTTGRLEFTVTTDELL